jgi:Leucine-rich repeat (LRR) protein
MRSKKRIIIILILIFSATHGKSQRTLETGLLSKKELEKTKVYASLIDAMKDPEQVIILDLTGQHLDSLPSTIEKFKNLQVLRLGWKIKDSTPKKIIRRSKKIGGGIIHLDRLQGKYVDYNQLTKLPSTISNLKKLQEINLGYNNLTEVPVELTHLKNLKFINLIGCYGLLNKEKELKEFKKMLPADCIVWSDIRLE